MSGPSMSLKTYLFTYVGLLALTLSTVLIGYVDLGWGSMFVAVLIAAAKATLIALFFMHALIEKKLVWLVIAGALVWFLILVSLTLGDYITRGWVPFPGK
jgi:cytochrome c oxidase subunit IV